MSSILKTRSQTSLKHFEEGCPRKWQGMWIHKSIPFFSNANMDKGSYFEYLCLGGGATDSEVTDLPRKKNGDKYIHQVRIENQAKKFKRLFDSNSDDFLGYTIIGNQRELFHSNGLDRGTLDFDTESVSDKSKKVIWDLKFTGDATATRHPKHWGHPSHMLDVTQAVWYADLWNDNFGIIPEFWYLIFDVKPEENIKRVKVTVSEDDILTLNNRKDNLMRKLDEYEEDGYPEKPEKYECKSCPLDCWSRAEPFDVS